MSQKEKSKIDIPVLILFFNRPNMLKRVFEQVKIAKPSKLYLFQDGARENRLDDVVNVQKCREVVSDIDWECEVYTNYQEKNNGCDPSEYLAQGEKILGSFGTAKQPQLEKPTIRPQTRDEFWQTYDKKGIRPLLTKYGGLKKSSTKTLLYKIKKKIFR